MSKKAKQWNEGKIEFRKKRYEITVNADNKDDPVSWVDELLSRILAKLADATTEAAHQLTELYNSSWVQDWELKPAGIKRRIKLTSMSLNRDESWGMLFSDGDLFGGHWIRVTVGADGEVSSELWGQEFSKRRSRFQYGKDRLKEPRINANKHE